MKLTCVENKEGHGWIWLISLHTTSKFHINPIFCPFDRDILACISHHARTVVALYLNKAHGHLMGDLLRANKVSSATRLQVPRFAAARPRA